MFSRYQRPSLPNIYPDSPVYAHSVPGTIPLNNDKQLPQDPTEHAHDLLVTQMCKNDDTIRQVMKASSRLRADMEQVSKSAHSFSQLLGGLSEQFSTLVLSSAIDPIDDSEEAHKRDMLVAAVHQLAKYYTLVAQHQQMMAVSMSNDFESFVQDRQDKHREKCKQWANDYNASVVSLLDYIDSMQTMAKDPTVSHKDEIHTEISNKQEEVDDTKKVKILSMIKSERHHYVHFTHRLQSSFRLQLSCYKDLYQQNLSNIPNFLSNINQVQDILSKGDKPSQLLLRLRRPSEPIITTGYERSDITLNTTMSTIGKHAADKLSGRMHTGDSGVDLASQGSSSGRGSPEMGGQAVQRSQSENLNMLSVRRTGAPRRTMMTPSVRYTKRATSVDPRTSMASMAKIKNLLSDKNIDIQKAIMLYDYDGQGEADMSVRRDQEVDVISVEGEWAYAIKETRGADGKKNVVMGWIPLAFTSLCDELQFDE